MKKRLTTFGLCLSLILVSSSTFAQTVTLTESDHEIAVTIDGQEFTVFHNDPKFPKPFFAPVRGPDGTILTRPIDGLDSKPEDKLDHVHHKGIWLSVDEINGNQHWAEKSKIVNTSTKIITAEGNPAVLDVVNEWRNVDGETVAVTESTRISIYANRLVTYDITFSAGDEMVEFEDTKEGLFGFRMIDSMREKVGGRVVNAEGLKGTAECWGKMSAWVDYDGEVDGKTFGVTIMDHPLNFRPSRYHVRDYGLFSVSPFGPKSYTNGEQPADPVIIPAGGTLRLRYGMYIHSGDTEAADVAGVYRGWLAGDVPQPVIEAAATEPATSEEETPPAVEVETDMEEETHADDETEDESISDESIDSESDCCGHEPVRRQRRVRRCRGC